jgi:predicted phage terminase large subunit-like protein
MGKREEVRALIAGELAQDLNRLMPQIQQELIRREGVRAKKSLHSFLVNFAWPTLFPATPFKDNWHIHAICEHLEAVTHGQIKRLLINMPFRHLKSTIISQAWPAWEWLTNPSTEYLTASYAKDLATRDAVNSRRIIESDKYQQCFGETFAMTSDQNVKTRYENDRRGQRTVTSTDSGGTGFGGGRLVISAKLADSIVAIQASVEWYKGTLITRLNDPKEDAIVITHQRLNEGDLTGYILNNEDMAAWTHLVLPLRFDPELSKKTFLFSDPRKVKGEMLHADRIDDETARSMEKNLGAYHTSAQLQQNPGTRSGVIFDRNKFGTYSKPPKLSDTVISVDCTFKDLATSDFVAIHVWGIDGNTQKKYLRYRIRERLGFGATCTAIENVVARFPERIAILIEDKANGSAVIETLSQKFTGIVPINPEGGKVARAFAMQPEQEAGDIILPDASVDPDIETFVFAATKFPNPTVADDEVDAMTQAINWYRVRGKTVGMIEYMKQQMEARAAKGRPL